MMEFLYFPQDKAEYIPALISLLVFMTLAVVTFYFIQRHSKKEEEKVNAKYGISPASEDKSKQNYTSKPPL